MISHTKPSKNPNLDVAKNNLELQRLFHEVCKLALKKDIDALKQYVKDGNCIQVKYYHGRFYHTPCSLLVALGERHVVTTLYAAGGKGILNSAAYGFALRGDSENVQQMIFWGACLDAAMVGYIAQYDKKQLELVRLKKNKHQLMDGIDAVVLDLLDRGASIDVAIKAYQKVGKVKRVKKLIKMGGSAKATTVGLLGADATTSVSFLAQMGFPESALKRNKTQSSLVREYAMGGNSVVAVQLLEKNVDDLLCGLAIGRQQALFVQMMAEFSQDFSALKKAIYYCAKQSHHALVSTILSLHLNSVHFKELFDTATSGFFQAGMYSKQSILRTYYFLGKDVLAKAMLIHSLDRQPLDEALFVRLQIMLALKEYQQIPYSEALSKTALPIREYNPQTYIQYRNTILSNLAKFSRSINQNSESYLRINELEEILNPKINDYNYPLMLTRFKRAVTQLNVYAGNRQTFYNVVTIFFILALLVRLAHCKYKHNDLIFWKSDLQRFKAQMLSDLDGLPELQIYRIAFPPKKIQNDKLEPLKAPAANVTMFCLFNERKRSRCDVVKLEENRKKLDIGVDVSSVRSFIRKK